MIKVFLYNIFLFWVDIFLFLWQLPQNIIGIIWLNINLIFYYGISHIKTINDNIYVYELPGYTGSISLGKYIIVSKYRNDLTIQHEYGHCKQSMYLGPFYLIVIGIPSIIWNGISDYTNKDYYWFYTEKWADKLANIKR
jgi:hypothetical protein